MLSTSFCAMVALPYLRGLQQSKQGARQREARASPKQARPVVPPANGTAQPPNPIPPSGQHEHEREHEREHEHGPEQVHRWRESRRQVRAAEECGRSFRRVLCPCRGLRRTARRRTAPPEGRRRRRRWLGRSRRRCPRGSRTRLRLRRVGGPRRHSRAGSGAVSTQVPAPCRGSGRGRGDAKAPISAWAVLGERRQRTRWARA